jgi:hypothetical protein
MSYLSSFLSEARDSSSRKIPEGAFDSGDVARAPRGDLDRDDSRVFMFGGRLALPRGVADGAQTADIPRTTRVERSLTPLAR